MELDLEPELGPDPPAIRFDLGQRLAAVNLRLAFSQEIEIGTVQDGDDRAQGRFPAMAPPAPFRGVGNTAYAGAHRARRVAERPIATPLTPLKRGEGVNGSQ